MNPFVILLFLRSLSNSAGKTDQAVKAYKIDFYALQVVDLGTGGLSLVFGEDAGFVTDGTKVVTLRYGAMDKATGHIAHMKEDKPHTPIDAQYYAKPNAVVVKSPHVATFVFDADNIATVDSSHFLGKCFQGTTETCSALISKILAAGINLDAAVVVGVRDYMLHHGQIPPRAHSWREVLHFLER